MQNRQEPVLQIDTILSKKWLLFYKIQKAIVLNQQKLPFVPFEKSIIEWYLRAVQGGTFTGKRFTDIKTTMDSYLFSHMCSIFQTVKVNIYIPQPLTLYRCIYLDPNLVAPQKSLSHKIPSSWTFSKEYAKFWCLKQPELGKMPYILELKVYPRDTFVFNCFNETQYEVVLPPFILDMNNIKNKNIVECSLKNYYRISQNGNMYIP